MAFWSRKTEPKPEPPPPPPPSGTLTGGDVQRLLEASCARAAQAIILSSDSGTTYNGRFRELRGDTLTLVISSAERPAINVLAMCVVTFNHGSKARVFLSSVLGAESSQGEHVYILQVPGEMAGADGRFAMRVPVGDGHGVTAEVQHEGRRLAARALDISLTGVQLELPDDPGLAVDGRIAVHLRSGGAAITLEGLVRRASGGRYGVFFPETVTEGGRVDAPDALVTIVRDLERHWQLSRD